MHERQLWERAESRSLTKAGNPLRWIASLSDPVSSLQNVPSQFIQTIIYPKVLLFWRTS